MNHAMSSFSVLNDAFKRSLTTDSYQSDQPPEITVPLRPHQKAILHEMYKREQELSSGLGVNASTFFPAQDVSGARLFSRFAYLGDGVGVGKSLMILGYIAKLKTCPPLKSIATLDPTSTPNIYSLFDVSEDTNLSDAACLIVVPHTLFRQWQNYIKDQTRLNVFFVQTKKALSTDGSVEENAELVRKIRTSDIVLVSNTLYGDLQAIAEANHLIWKRAFFDEADTIHLPSTRPRAKTRFTWLISASWPNLLFGNSSNYITNAIANTMLANPNIDPALVQHIQQMISTPGTTHTAYWYNKYYVVSNSFFHDFISHAGRHSLRGHLVVRCRDEFVRESITLPPIQIRNIMCRQSVGQQLVSGVIDASVRALLHAGDISGALISLGVKSDEPMSLVQAVTGNKVKELDRLKKTYDFKESIEYSSPQAKEAALKNLKDKITSLESQIKGLKERIENYKDEVCPICFDESQSPMLTPCCNRIFCAGCILASLTRTPSCPLCRATIQAAMLRGLSLNTDSKKKKNTIVDPTAPPEPLKKPEQLIELLKTTKNGRFLVFSRYDNPFLTLTTEIEALNMTVKQVRGNKDVIASTLKSFQKGETKVLLLNSIQAGAGLNITAATHVILLHAMTHEEEKQILGRAYRLGRTEPLEVIRLLHPDEMIHAQH